MKYRMLLLMIPLLCAGCVTAPSSTTEKADRITVPAVKAYTPKQQNQAADEMEKYCNSTPMVCQVVGDYGKMRDQARVALGLKVNVTR